MSHQDNSGKVKCGEINLTDELIPMTTDSMTLIQTVQQVDDADLLRQLAEVALTQLMALEVDGMVGTAKSNPLREYFPLWTRLVCQAISSC